MTASKKKTKKQRLIQLIHIGKNKVGLTDEDYRALLHSATGKRSCTKMNEAELSASLEAIKKLGFTVRRLPLKDIDVGCATKEQLDYIKGLWELVARVKTESALSAFVKRLTGVPFLRWLKVKDAQRVILALRDMAEKAGYDVQ